MADPYAPLKRLRASMIDILAGALFAAIPLYGQGARVSSPAELARIADALQPGEWVWAGSVAPAGPVLIYVDLSRQRATVYRNGVRIAVTTISSGKRGFDPDWCLHYPPEGRPPPLKEVR